MKKSIKKTLSLVLIILSILALVGQSVLAAQNISEKLLKEIDKTNEFIMKEVQKTKDKAEKEASKNKMSERQFESYLDELIGKLIEKTEKKADKLIEKAAKEGVVLEKTYIEVVICDRIVLVDPFYAH